MSDQEQTGPTCMESVNRISKLPVVESTIQTGKGYYDKIKDYNSVTNWTMSTAENTVYKAVEVGKPYTVPVVNSLEGPIKKVDDILCSGLDYVEAKIPAVKMPTSELYTSTKDMITNSTTVKAACVVVQPAMETAKNTVQGAKNMMAPALETATHMVEPAVQGAKQIVEPYASAIKGYLQENPNTSLNNSEPEDEGSSAECADCEGDSNKH